jgi:hypothetical protein
VINPVNEAVLPGRIFNDAVREPSAFQIENSDHRKEQGKYDRPVATTRHSASQQPYGPGEDTSSDYTNTKDHDLGERKPN